MFDGYPFALQCQNKLEFSMTVLFDGAKSITASPEMG